MEEEIWKDIIGYEGLYRISNKLNVLQLSKNRLLAKVQQQSGYTTVALRKNGKSKLFVSHRLLAIHFIPNPENKPQVNHINGVKNDNRMENLEWVTQSENMLHSCWVLGNRFPKGFKRPRKTCVCGKEFQPLKDCGKYCSKKCADKHNLRNQKL